MSLEKPATVAIVDGNTGKAIAYRNITQLLSKKKSERKKPTNSKKKQRKPYSLLNRQRKQKQHLSHLRHKAQRCCC